MASRETVAPSSGDSTFSGPFATLPADFGRFRVLKLLGRGAMGTVYLATDPDRKQDVALKIPRFLADDDPVLFERFRREARAASGLDHPNICKVYDVGQVNSLHFISMQYVDGRPLSDYISAEQPQRGIAAVIRKLALALAHAHSRGVIHRDLKPANVMVDGRSEPVMMDFGLARQIDATDPRATQSGMLVGSPAYMAPEQARAEHDKIGPHTDIYGLGVLFFEMLTGRLPFQGAIVVVLGQVVNQAAPKPSSIRPDIDPKLEALCLKMLQKKPEDRPASMEDVARNLAEWLQPEQKIASGASASPVASKEVAPLAPVKAAAPKVDKTNPVVVQQERVRELLADFDYAGAIALLERFIKTKDPRFEKLAIWAKAELPKVRQQEQNLRDASAPMCATARKLLEHHDYSEAVKLLEEIPPEFRSIELRDLLQECLERRDECDHLERDIADAIRNNDEVLLPTLVKRLLKLKPANKSLKKLHEDLKRYGTAKVIEQRKGQKRFLQLNKEQTFETKHVVGFIVGLVALCVTVYFSVVMYVGNSEKPSALIPVGELKPNLAANARQGAGDGAPGSVIPPDAATFQGHSYKYFPERLSWTAAKRRCEELGGHLPIVESRDENEFLVKTAQAGMKVSDKAKDYGIWLGATDVAMEKQWRWLDDSGMAFSNWFANQPNNKGGKEHYAVAVVIPSQGVKPGDWNDQPEESTDQIVHFVCEWDSLQNDKGSDGEWINLFTGTDLNGWWGDKSVWTIDQGVLRLNPDKINSNHRLVSQQSFADFELRFQYRILNEGQTGVWLRAGASKPGAMVQLGYYTHPDGNKTSVTGDLFAMVDGKPTQLGQPNRSQRSVLQKADKAGSWNDVSIRCEGPRMILEVNNLRAVDFTDKDSKMARNGELHFAAPSYDKAKAEFRNVRLLKLGAVSPKESPSLLTKSASAGDNNKTASAGSTATSPGAKPALDIDFRKTDGGCYSGDSPEFLVQHQKGEYRYVAKKPGWWIHWLHPVLGETDQKPPRDFEFEVDLRFVDQAQGEVAIAFGSCNGKKFDVYLNRAGEVKLANDELGDIVPWTKPANLRDLTSFNTIRLNVQDRLAQVYVNGTKLMESHLARYAPGAVHIWLGPAKTPLEIRLQRIRLERREPSGPNIEVTLSQRRLKGHTDIIRGVAFLPDNQRAVSVGNGKAFKMWNVQSGELLHDFTGHAGHVTSVSVSQDGKRALTGCQDMAVRLWDLENKKVLKTLRVHTAPVRSVWISPDGTAALSASIDNMIRRWDLGTSKSVLVSNAAPDASLAVSPDGNIVATGHPNGLVVLRSLQGEVLVTGHSQARVEALAFTPDGSRLVSAGQDATVCVWDLQSGKHVYRLEADDQGFASVAVTSDGRTAIAGCMDKTIRAWDLESGNAIFVSRTDQPVTHRLALSPQNDYLLTGGGDTTGKPSGDYDLRVWKLPSPLTPDKP